MDPITSSFASTATSQAAQPQSKAKEQQNQFLQILVAQLKGQNPLNPADGSEFVAQLAQFSSLEELTQIRASMETVQQLLTSQNETREEIQ